MTSKQNWLGFGPAVLLNVRRIMVRPSDRLAPCRHFLRLFIGSITAWITPLSAQSYQWENLAGLGGGPGHEDGPVATAKILYPSSTVADSQGNI